MIKDNQFDYEYFSLFYLFLLVEVLVGRRPMFVIIIVGVVFVLFFTSPKCSFFASTVVGVINNFDTWHAAWVTYRATHSLTC